MTGKHLQIFSQEATVQSGQVSYSTVVEKPDGQKEHSGIVCLKSYRDGVDLFFLSVFQVFYTDARKLFANLFSFRSAVSASTAEFSGEQSSKMMTSRFE